MIAYIIRRLLVTIPLLLIALYLVHVGVSTTTDPRAPFYLCLPRCQDGFDFITEQYNLDQSIWLRPFSWFGNAIQGDFGESVSYSEPVGSVLLERGKNTAMIAIPVVACRLSERENSPSTMPSV